MPLPLTEGDINVRYKQQRLLLLRHASKCKHGPGSCPVTPYCQAMKELWNHVVQCKNQECNVRHCISSRYILSHYRKCRDEDCASCGPVRTAIRRSKEKRAAAKRALAANQNVVTNDNSSTDSSRISADEEIAGKFRCESPPKKRKTAHNASADENATNHTRTPLLQGAAVVSPYPNKDATNRPLQKHLKWACLDILTGLQTHQHGWVFNRPVDPVELCLPDYYEIIQSPMDLGTVHTNLTNDSYRTPNDFEADVNLTFDNALTYNPEGSEVYRMALELKTKFQEDFQALVADQEAKEKEHRRNMNETLSMEPL